MSFPDNDPVALLELRSLLLFSVPVEVQATDERINRAGFAKLVLIEPDKPPVDHILKKYVIKIGRMNKKEQPDVALDEKYQSVSRTHALIRYNFEAQGFELEVLGKNGKKRGEVR